MKIQRTSRVAVLMLAALALAISATGFTQSAVAQPAVQQFQQPGTSEQKIRIAPAISPMPQTPRLGFTGEMIYGYGMRVLGTNWGSPASQVGLERGDIILSINGRRILCQWDYDNALRDAVMYRGGMVGLTVRNVRYDLGQSYQQYVSVSTQLSGYGPGMPVAASQAGGGMSQWSGQGGGVAMRSGNRSRRSAKSRRPAVTEIAADKIPAMKNGQQGTGQ